MDREQTYYAQDAFWQALWSLMLSFEWETKNKFQNSSYILEVVKVKTS